MTAMDEQHQRMHQSRRRSLNQRDAEELRQPCFARAASTARSRATNPLRASGRIAWMTLSPLCGIDGDFIAERGQSRPTVPVEPSVEPWPVR